MNVEELLTLLVCPKCHGKLTAVGGDPQATGLQCPACSLLYALDDGLPNMLLSDAQPVPHDA